MRLTLRTLLAWLDGVLPGEEQVQLGEKVSASQTASLLAERIRLAVTRPAIAAPAPDARGLADDANSVADFLDNTLSADQLAAFERICLESDMHLAEVAACHTMLAAMARQSPPALTPAERRRLQTAVHERLDREPFGAAGGGTPHAAGDGHEDSRQTARALRAALGPGAEEEAAMAAAGRGPHEPGGPAPRPIVDGPSAGGGHRPMPPRRSSQAAWWSAVIAVSLLVALAGVLGWRGLRGGSRRIAPAETTAGPRRPADEPPPAVAPPADAVAAAAAGEAGADAGKTPADAGKVAADDGQVAAAAAPAAEPPAMRPAADSADGAAKENVAVAAADGQPGAKQSPPQPQPGVPPSAVAAVGTPRMEPTSRGPVGPVPGAPERPAAATDAAAEPAPQIVVVGGPLLRRVKNGEAEEWRRVAAGTALDPRDEVIVPPWCEAKLAVGGSDVALLAQTDAAFLVDLDGTPRLDMLFGRAVVGGNAASRLGVTAGGLTGVIAGEPATRIAIEVAADRPGGNAADPAAAAAGSFVTAGQRPFTWQPTSTDGTAPPGAGPLTVAAGAAVVWRDGRAALASTPPPSWIEGPGFPDRVQKSAAETLATRIAADRPLLLSLRELAADRRIENRMIAAATLALIGQSDELVDLLAADAGNRSKLEDQQWLTLERMAMQATLARGGEAAAGLHRALVKFAPEGKADLLWAMARGFSDADIAGGGAAVLVDGLEDPSLMVRRYAYKTLCDITRPSATDRLKYRPDALPNLRREGVTWWRSLLERGLIHR